MGLTPDSFQSIRFRTPERILSADRLLTLAAEVGAAGAHGGMTDMSFDWAHRTRRLKEELDMFLEIQTFLPRPDGEEGDPDVTEVHRVPADGQLVGQHPVLPHEHLRGLPGRGRDTRYGVDDQEPRGL